MSLLAVVGAVGVIFAFNNSETRHDAYGSIAVYVNQTDIDLAIEVERDDTDTGLRLVDTPSRSTTLTITVGGLPDTADRGVTFNSSSASSGVVSVTPTSFDQKSGVSRFLITGQNGGAPVTLLFTTRSGNQTIAVNVKVNLTAKDFRLTKGAHFGIRQNGTALDFNKTSALSKLDFYAHPDDKKQTYKPNNYPLQFALAEDYAGVTLTDGVLQVNEDFVFDDGAEGREIYVLAQLPAMAEAVVIPVYVFRPADTITVSSDAFVPTTTDDNVYDLILNRSERASAKFTFALPENQGVPEKDYNFYVVPQDTTMVEVKKDVMAGTYELSAIRNTGRTAVTVTAYPRAYMTVDGQQQYVWFNNQDTDANVFITQSVYLRVRNEFIDQQETGGFVNYKLQYSKDQLSAFYYEGTGAGFTDQFTLDTKNNQPITFDNDIEFQLVVENLNHQKTIYDHESGLFSILNLYVYRNGQWQAFDRQNYTANYREQFAIALTRTTEAEDFLTHDVAQMWLRAKSVSPLSTSTADTLRYATCDVPLAAYGAIDDFQISNLTTLDDGTTGVALVHKQNHDEVSAVSLDVYGIVTQNDDWGYSGHWLPSAITTNNNLPFTVTYVDHLDGVAKRTYTLTLRHGANVQYYNSYPFTLTYPNGVTRTIYIKVFPTVTQVNMNVVSDNHGQIYRTVKDPNNREYIKTVYVKQGSTYRINVTTADVSVGAYAEITENEQTTLTFDARNRAEGIYPVTAHLHAYSDDVYTNHQQDFAVNFVVVSPVGNVAAPSAITLAGIGQSSEVVVAPTSGSEEYLCVEPVLQDPNVVIERLTTTRFRLTARYLPEEKVVIGFRVYKRYAFGSDFDGDGEEDVFDIQYTAGNLITIEVTIATNERVSGVKINGDAVLTEKNIGQYVTIISEPLAPVTLNAITLGTDTNHQGIGFAFAKYQDGNFDLTNLLDADAVPVLDGATVDGNSVVITPKAGKRSLGQYAVVAYAKDSLHLVAMVDGEAVVVPYTYEVIPLYIGEADEIEKIIEEMKNNIPHDANSGRLNNLGGYNWVVAAENPYDAVLFYTDPHTHAEYASNIEANRYYLDDLDTVLGEKWGDALTQNEYELTKYVDNVVTDLNAIELASRLNAAEGRMYLQVGDCSDATREVYYQLTVGNFNLHFYLAPGVEKFTVSIAQGGNDGSASIIAEKNLTDQGTAADQYREAIKVQRGRPFQLQGDTNTGADTLWQISSNPASTNNLGGPGYAGGSYEFTPCIVFHDANGNPQQFNLTALRTVVKVGITGGVQYLSMAQSTNTLDGATSAVYNATVRTDENWHTSLLNYVLDYDGVRYPLFVNVTDQGTVTDEVLMEGGNAAFYFKLIPTVDEYPINYYYTHYLRLEVTVILKSATTNPFSNVSGARIVLQENLVGSNLEGRKVAREVSAGLNIVKQGITNVTMSHFANINVDATTGNITVPNYQSDTNVIYIDNSVVGGLLTVHPSPYYLDVDSMSIECVKPVEVTSQIGTSLDGEAVMGTARYTVGFAQLVYNTDEQVYQNFLSGTSPKMVSTWSKKDGYQWNGRYYFRTFLRCDGQADAIIPDGAEFKIAVTITSEGYKKITEQMSVYAKYKDGIVVTPDDSGTSYPISTMMQTNYQALGTSAVYDIAFPEGYLPNYLGYSVHGDGKDYVTVKVDAAAKTVSVRLAGDSSLINKTIEIRFPYRAAGDFVNPYLSVVIVPVYFQFTGLSVANHIETPILLLGDETIDDLTYRVVANYDPALSVVKSRLSDFNGDLRSSGLLKFIDERIGVRSVQFSYSYLDGIPVIMRGGELVYEQTIYYQTTEQREVLERTTYLAIGCEDTFDFEFDPIRKYNWYVKNMTGASTDLWSVNMSRDGSGIFSVSLTNNTALIGNTLTVEIASNRGTDLLLHVVPVYFTFTGFKTQDYPVDPLIALSQPFVVTLAADNVVTAGGIDATKALNNFNSALLQAQEDADKDIINFTRVPNEDGILNFNFSETTREITRNDLESPLTAISHLKATASITYVNGCPQLVKDGSANAQKITTYFTVKTYGSDPDSGDDNNDPLDPQPSSRYRKVAQAIGTQVTYNIALKDVTFDNALDCYETSNTVDHRPWSSSSAWRAKLSGKSIIVELQPDTALFGMTLVIDVYSAEDKNEPVYTLNIVPAWFTVENLVVVGHSGENPLQIIRPETVDNLRLDFETVHGDVEGYDYETRIKAFREALLDTQLITRIADRGLLTLLLALRYNNGEPEIVSRAVSGALLVQNTFRYELLASGPKVATLAQAIGTTIEYDRVPYGKKVTVLKKYYYDPDDSQADADGYVQFFTRQEEGKPYTNCDIYKDSINDRLFRIALDYDTNLFNYRFKFEVYTDGTGTPECVLYVVPAYFVVSGLAVDGQSGDEIWFVTENTPADVNALINGVDYVGVIDSRNLNNSDISSMLANFNLQQLQEKAELIERSYDSEATAGRLTATIYVKYVNGEPILVAPDAAWDVCLPTDFNYHVYGPNDYNPNYPDLPSGPRTRSAVQAIGTTARYRIDLPAGQALNTRDLTDNDGLWTAVWEDEELLVTLKADTALLNETIKLSFQSLLDFSEQACLFELTIKPVLFEVVGFAVADHPEQPATLLNAADKTNVVAVTKHMDIYQTGDVKYNKAVRLLRQQLNIFNTQVLARRIAEGNEQFWQTDDELGADGNGMLTFRAAINYSDRTMPRLANIDNYPLAVIESAVAYQMIDGDAAAGSAATYHQPIGTTEYYPLPDKFLNDTLHFKGGSSTISGTMWDAAIVKYSGYGTQYAVRVNCQSTQNNLGTNLLGTDLQLELVDASNRHVFTLTIKPVYFVVEGFEVAYHPERPLWLLSTTDYTENVSSLQFTAKVRRSDYAWLKGEIDAELANFNNNLQNIWGSYLEKYTIGGEYLVVRGAIDYHTTTVDGQLADGNADVVPLSWFGQGNVQLVRSVFQYQIYNNTGSELPDSGIVRPTGTRTRTVGQAIGLTDTYTIDLDDLSNFSAVNLKLTEEYQNGTVKDWNSDSGWQVQASGNNRLTVVLEPNADLLNRTLVIAISYSADYYSPAFILRVQPAWFTVTGIALKGHPENPIKVDSLSAFLASGERVYEPITAYAPELASEVEPKVNAFIARFQNEDFLFVYKTSHTSSDGKTAYLRATTTVRYTYPSDDPNNKHDGVYLTRGTPEDRLWNVFTVVENSADHTLSKTVVQGIGSTKEYYLDAPIGEGIYNSNDGNATAVVKGNRTTVTLKADGRLPESGRYVDLVLGNLFTLRITPVWFEVESLAVAGHPERPVWLFAPATTANLTYRAVTNDDIPDGFDIAEKVAAFNASLNEQRATLVSETVSQNRYVTVNAAIDYVNGMPTLVRINGDFSNVVEVVFEYYVWSDSRVPEPKHPAVINTTCFNQVIGGAKTYTLKNIPGKIYYQWLWVEGAGDLTASVADNTLAYEGAAINFDVLKNTLTVDLAGDVNYLNQPIKVNIPYLVTVNKQEVWYTHCLEITPLLLEVYGWQIVPDATAEGADSSKYEMVDDYLRLHDNQFTPVKAYFAPKVNHSKIDDATLQSAITTAKAELQKQINDNLALLTLDFADDYIKINTDKNELVLMQYSAEDTNTTVTMSGKVVYVNGRPQAVMTGGSTISNQVIIGTGDPQPWPPETPIIGHQTAGLQAIGTEQTYQLDFQGENYTKVLYDDMEIRWNGVLLNPKTVYDLDNSSTTELPAIDGEYDLVTVDVNQETDSLTVNLAAVLALSAHEVVIDLPYQVDTGLIENGVAVMATKYYRLQITPVWYLLNNFTLANHPSNYLELDDRDVQITLSANVSRSDKAANSVRTNINAAITNLENQLATMLLNQGVKTAWTITNLDGTVNNYIAVVSMGGSLWLQRTGMATASHRVTTQIRVIYTDGVPVLVTDPTAPADVTFTVEILVDTDENSASFFPGLDKVKQGERLEFQQAIGTSKTYKIDKTNNATETLYFKWLTVKNGGPKRDANNYEWFDLQITGGSNYGEVRVTFKPQVRLLINPIEIMIPYAKYQTEDGQEGDIVWYYYNLVIKPVLFEVTGWGVEDVNGQVVNELTINDSALELKFAPIIRSAPLDNQTFLDNPDDPDNANTSELIFISNSIRNLKKQINDYNEAVADKYTYLVINNYPEEGHQVNYSMYRDNGAQKTYIVRDVNENTHTIVDLSATISYQVNSFDTTAVNGVQAVVGYDDVSKGLRVSSSIRINTTNQSASDENLMVITQDNAEVLQNLMPNTDYILMGDIYLSQVKIPGLQTQPEGWRPATFPAGATLDGNNYKIYLDTNFDLSNNPTNIGVFSNIPSGSVIKNLHVVIPQGTSFDKARTVEVNLTGYTNGNVNIGLLAGSNNGVITNCAVLSDWQFVQDLSNVINPLDGKKFTTNLQFNMDGYLFGRLPYNGKEEVYFFETSMNNDREVVIERIYNSHGYRLIKVGDSWVEYVDKYMNNIEFITPDTTNVAHYDNYSTMMRNGSSAARLLVKGTNAELNVVLGGLVGLNSHMVTNSRVLIDIELTDLANGAENVDDEISVSSAMVGGFVGNNANGATITASYFRDGNIINNANVDSLKTDAICYLGGFVGLNQGKIMQSYAMGQSTNREAYAPNFTSGAGGVKTSRNSLGGFVHQNEGTITDCLVNVVIEKGGLDGFAGGFVYRNTTNGKISNCVENNLLVLIDESSAPLYKPFIALNSTMTIDDVKAGNNTITDNLTNLYYAGNLEKVSASQFIKAGVLTQLSNNSTAKYSAIDSYQDFSIGQDRKKVWYQTEDGQMMYWYISNQNTIWSMTDLGPMLRTPNDIAISSRKTIAQSSPYLFAPGTARNPYLLWDKDQFRRYVYEATPTATKADQNGTRQNVDLNRQGNNLRLVDDVTLDGIQDTYKITYTGTLEGNGLTLGGIGLSSVATNLATAGLFGKTEYATIRNINFAFNNNINSTARYVGGIAGISINTNFVDVTIDESSSTIMGANIVGGLVGLAVINDTNVENYNINSSISAKANYSEGVTSPGSSRFTSGEEYLQQTLYSRVEYRQIPREQAFGTAGGVFGFVTSNPNNYKVLDADGNARIVTREATTRYEIKNTLDGTVDVQNLSSKNTDATMFLRDRNGKAIDDTNLYYTDQIVLRNVGGNVHDVSGNVAGGLIGIMDETIELRDPTLSGLSKLTGKYYLGGVVGINLGKIAGGSVAQVTTKGTSALSFNVNSSVNGSYIFRYDSDVENPKHFWGMTVGAVAAYNNGLADNANSGTIENVQVNVNVFSTGNTNKIYVLGGVVGEAGTYSTITDTVNDVFRTNNNAVLFSPSDFTKVGFYVGKIVGRAVLNADQARSTMIMLPASEENMYQACYVTPTDFATPYYKINGVLTNAFGVNDDGTTYKVQTMTMDEYKQYVLYNLVNGNATISEIVAALEPWYRSLPTYISSATINGKNVFVEKLTETAKNEFVTWLSDNEVFNNFNAFTYTETDTSGATVTKNRLLNDYAAYLDYCAISPVDAGEAWFRENLTACRDQRYQLAKEFFAYKTKAAASSSQYPANICFTWAQYENYRYLLAALNMQENNYYQCLYGDEVLKYSADITYIALWLDDQNLTELGEAQGTSGNRVKLSGYGELQNLLDGRADDTIQQFSVRDPLQAYINFVTDGYTYRRTLGTITETITHSPYGQRGQAWQMTFKQYVHFVNTIAGNEYGNEEAKGKYDADLIADYFYSCYNLNQAASSAINLNDYMVYKITEIPTVLKGELAWIKTGHQQGDVQLGNVGAVELGWVANETTWKDLLKDTAKVKVEQRDNEIVYLNTQDGTQVQKIWDAANQYELARTQGLDIVKYQEICRLGGSLYELRKTRVVDGKTEYIYATADAYIFSLKAAQYGWTPDQTSFISGTFGLDNIRYALSATYYGNILQQTLDNVVAVDTTRVRQHKFVGNRWFYDANDDGDEFDTDTDRKGTWQLNVAGGNVGHTFTNGDGQVYTFVKNQAIDLRENTDPTKGRVQGAALYVDADGDKMFTLDDADQAIGSGDSLVLYEVAESENPEFKQDIKDEKGKVTGTKYFKISRRILPKADRQTTNIQNEYTDNTADYLEEALWWQSQGFTADQFDQIKDHAMRASIPEAGQVVLQRTGTNTYQVMDRGVGFTVADDWYAAANGETYGFRTERFSTTDYTTIVTNAQYATRTDATSGKTTNYWWYSTYADYVLFRGLLNADTLNAGGSGSDSMKIDDAETLAKEYLPYPDNGQPWWAQRPDNAWYVDNPFGKTENRMDDFVNKLVDEKVLASAMEFGSDKEAYLKLLATGHTTADYVAWAKNSVRSATPKGEYFRMNHYIYWQSQNKGDLIGTKVTNFCFALQQSNRELIYYTGVTQEARTTELLAFKEEWDGYITFDNYQEWLNVYAHGDDFKTDRGELMEGQEASAEGWLTIYAFATWKRMEKYENHVEYVNKSSTNAGITQIAEPKLNRKISTTVFPKIASSGNANGAGGKPTLPNLLPDDNIVMTNALKEWYGWYSEKQVLTEDKNGSIEYNGKKYKETKAGVYYNMPTDRQRPFLDRYEYNEKYLAAYYDPTTETTTAYTVRPIGKWSGGMTEEDWEWANRYQEDNPSRDEGHDTYRRLMLDETQFVVRTERKDKDGNTMTDKGKILYNYEKKLGTYFTQLYVPFDYFKRACQMIQSMYSADNDYAGYHNYMHYWAKNGQWNWIADNSECPDIEYETTGPYPSQDAQGKETQYVFKAVQYTYRNTSFWNDFKPENDKDAIGREKQTINW